MDMNTFMLDFPNDEVKRGFVTLLTNNYLKPKENIDSWMSNAVAKLEKGDLEAFHERLTAFLASIPYTMRRKGNEREKERYYHYTFYLLLRLLTRIWFIRRSRRAKAGWTASSRRGNSSTSLSSSSTVRPMRLYGRSPTKAMPANMLPTAEGST